MFALSHSLTGQEPVANIIPAPGHKLQKNRISHI